MYQEMRTKDDAWMQSIHESIDQLSEILDSMPKDGTTLQNNDEYLCDKEVAYMLKVSRRTLSEYRSNGTLPYYVLGGKVLYKRSEIEQFILRVSNSPVVKNGKKKTNNWLDHQDVCQRLKISKRTLQTLRDNGTLAYTKIGNRTYYLPEDVDSIITKVEDRRKEARWKGREI